ncbi:MAG: hypothetical protein R6V21_08550 [Pelovirga sp.]
MKKMKPVILSLILSLGTFVPVFAQAGAREDNSMVLTYLFLGTCALIILLQFAPLMAMVFGMIKGVFGKKTQAEAKTVPVKTR